MIFFFCHYRQNWNDTCKRIWKRFREIHFSFPLLRLLFNSTSYGRYETEMSKKRKEKEKKKREKVNENSAINSNRKEIDEFLKWEMFDWQKGNGWNGNGNHMMKWENVWIGYIQLLAMSAPVVTNSNTKKWKHEINERRISKENECKPLFNPSQTVFFNWMCSIEVRKILTLEKKLNKILKCWYVEAFCCTFLVLPYLISLSVF